MDAKRETLTIRIAGVETLVYRPTESQMYGLHLWQKSTAPDADKLESITAMFLSLLDDAGKALFTSQLMMGGYTMQDMGETITAIARGYNNPAKAEPAKRTAKKTAAKKTAARP